MKKSLLVLSIATVCLVSGSVRADNTKIPPDKDTIALWNFSEGNGTITHAEGPSDVTLEFQEPGRASTQWEAGRDGSAIRFPGRLKSVSGSPALEVGEAVTLETWVKVSPDGPGNRMGIFQSMVYRQSGFRLEVDKAGRLVWEVESPGKELVIQSATLLYPDEWTHVAATYDGTVMKLFINGNLDAETTERGGVLFPDTDITFIGFTDSDEHANFRGVIDSVRISRVAKEIFDDAKRP